MGSSIFSSKMNTNVDAAIEGLWHVLQISDGRTGKMHVVSPSEPQMTIHFVNGYANLSAGGNGIGGEISASEGKYAIARYMTTTLKACDDVNTRQELRLSKAFSDRGSYQLKDGTLNLSNMDGLPTLIAVQD